MVSDGRLRVKSLFASLSVLAVFAGTLVGVGVAQADSIQHQSYQRANQSAPCPNQPGETPWQADWGPDSSWTPSWEQWANNGSGGWTCTRSITWARDSAARTYALGDTGPGGGLVFLISGGKTYEMAPKAWIGTADPTQRWATNAPVCYAVGSSIANQNCQTKDLYPETSAGAQAASTAAAVAIGMGAANTDAIVARMVAGDETSDLYAAGMARAYRGGGFTDWFLPSKDELNAMCNYSRNPITPPTGACTGAQNGTFAGGAFGFASDNYWSSSQSSIQIVDGVLEDAWNQELESGFPFIAEKLNNLLRVRPVRAF